MSQNINSYPGLKKAALEIAYDNSIIDRYQSEEEFLKQVDYIIAADGVYHSDLEMWSEWFDSLSEEDLMDVCCGESLEMERVLSAAPKNALLDALLNDIFSGRTTKQRRK